MKLLLKTLLLISIFIGIASCGGAKKALAEAREKARRDSIALAQKNAILPIQNKYGTILNVAPKKIDNIPLFKFIDDWMDTPYRMGGETKQGIDCSFFSQYLYHDIFDVLIERTAQKQYDAPDTNKFLGQEYLVEGDLIFFNKQGSEHYPITHVGVYLKNGKFVHSTARRGASGKNGVQISDLTKAHWQKMFVSAGRKPRTAKTSDSQ
ncbi:C40 family peptidase [Aquimarina hainanensis]|uniref:C40 family peptidase n=1 Tax=Aquimarina hainanensis TaxID=1578017 RepID=A0ABW5NFV1_9FLAO|nr:C40 family peptidase [Aquimarina sp. TRL1]QKX07179.1 C40 family peptidase [Aquimarina sp. TRL1]